VPASWVAASVRARLLARRRLGSARALELTRTGSLASALEILTGSPYGAQLTRDMSLEAAQREIAGTVLWNLRLLAGWLPPGGVQIMQPLAAWFELANIEERLAYLSGGRHPQPYQLGRLGAAWPAVSRATTMEAVHQAIARSRWGDPGEGGPAAWMIALRFGWAAWVAASVPGADVWAAAASVLLAARLKYSTDPPVSASRIRAFGLPPRWSEAASLADLRAMVSGQTAWVLDGIDDAADLWRAEPRWWARVRRDAGELLVASRFAEGVIAGAVGLLAYDAWLTRAALAAVARGDAGKAVFNAVA
jgi:hypothetical protein